MSEPLAYTAPTVNPKAHSRLLVIIMCQCRFVLGEKRILLVILIMGETVHVWGRRYMGNLCTSLSILL